MIMMKNAFATGDIEAERALMIMRTDLRRLKRRTCARPHEKSRSIVIGIGLSVIKMRIAIAITKASKQHQALDKYSRIQREDYQESLI